MKKVLILGLFVLLMSGFVIAQEEQNVCCEQTQSGLYCQDVPASECNPGARQLPTSCESTSYCKLGYCYDSNEGTCMDNTPQLVCNENGGVWSETEPAQCQLGCCLLGDQAAFVTLVRCKKLSGYLGLETNYRTDIQSEVQCVLTANNQEKGACVYDFEFERTCKFTTRFECEEGNEELGASQVEFFAGKLCSAEELATNCGPTRDTICLPGKDEVYFVDSCGNPANIYDSTKLSDKEYWGNIKSKEDSCRPGEANSESASCGNCNYLLGSYCREANSNSGFATYGENICADLNCENTENGQSYRHGESWCVYEDAGTTNRGVNSVGSRFFKHICINGEEVVEQCADFRQEECIQDAIQTTLGDFSQAACRVNRWQDCVSQETEIDCLNIDRRDCLWKEDQELFVGEEDQNAVQEGVCLPKNPPGLRFWESAQAQNVCAIGNAQCVVTFEKDLFGNEKCVDNCDCLEDDWEKQRADLCVNLGDCGPNVNWIGESGYKPGYNISIERV